MFNKASVKLTLQYTLLLLGIIWLLSFGIYGYMSQKFGGEYKNVQAYGNQNSDRSVGAIAAIDVGLRDLRRGILSVNVGLAIVTPGISFALARKTLKPLEEAYDRQKQFVDDASHELRTPLAIIMGELELTLRKPREAETYKKSIAASLREAQHMDELITNLLHMAQSSSLKPGISMATLDLQKVIQKTVRQQNKFARQ